MPVEIRELHDAWTLTSTAGPVPAAVPATAPATAPAPAEIAPPPPKYITRRN